MSTTDLARLAGLTRYRIRQLIVSGKIPARRVAGRWVIDHDVAARFLTGRAA